MKKLNYSIIIVFSVLLFMVFHQSVSGQDLLNPDTSLKDQIRAIDQMVRELEKQIETEKKTPEADPKSPIMEKAETTEFILKSPDGGNVLMIRGVIQFDSFFFNHDSPALTTTNGEFSYAPSTFNPRKVRPYFEGTVATYYDFRILPDFGNGQTVLQDAYLDFHYWSHIQLRGGKFKSPVGLERLQDESHLTFFERALATNLIPNRDVGFVLHGDPWGGAMSYALGILNGVADGEVLDADVNSDKDGVARIFFVPFKRSGAEYLKNLGIGIAGTYGNQQKGTAASPNLPSYRTAGQTTFFNYASGAVADGQHIRYSPQASYSWGPFGFLGEYAVSSQAVTMGSNTALLTNRAWQAAFSYVLTGEKASYNGIKPEHPFDPRKGHWGTVELAGRHSGLDIDPNAFPVYASGVSSAAGAREWGGGVNWYFNKNVKFVLNYFETSFEAVTGSTNHNDEKVFLSRWQLAF